MDGREECILCRGQASDAELQRIEVWRDELWRLTASLVAEVPGFCYLEPLRHIQHITDLAGPEATSFGPVLARVSRALRDATGAAWSTSTSSAAGSPPHLLSRPRSLSFPTASALRNLACSCSFFSAI
jgi:diadenosine tetraphosphate (Ap4A) HIT family hydrolase